MKVFFEVCYDMINMMGFVLLYVYVYMCVCVWAAVLSPLIRLFM